jgi:cyclase
MQRERVTENIFVFRSDQYVQVTAGVIITSMGAVLIDTLLYPEESLKIKRFVEERLSTTVRYVINTHFHADHTTGTCFFPDAQVISHRLCRELLDTRGRESLKKMQATSPEFELVELELPNIVFDDEITLTVGNTTFLLWSSPGHSPDSIACLVQDANVLFAADTVMPVPYFVDGDFVDFTKSLERLQNRPFENIIQGHGEVVLRGEVIEKIESDLAYLKILESIVEKALSDNIDNIEDHIPIEDCGKSHILLNGAVRQLHRQNVITLTNQLKERALLQAE